MTKKTTNMKPTHEQRNSIIEKQTWNGQYYLGRAEAEFLLARTLILNYDVALNYKHVRAT